MPRLYRRTGRPPGPTPGRSLAWTGKLGAFVATFTAARLAAELQLDPTDVGRYARGVHVPSIRRAVAIVEVARAAGASLTLEDVFQREIDRIRYRIRNQLPPL